MFKKLLLVFAVTGLAACTKANPNACCVNADDCKQVGLSSVKGCEQGLTCVDNQCIQQTCSTQGCMADKPVCNVVTNACDPCTASSQCMSYAGQNVCDTSIGSCVGCVASSDCPVEKPVCDMMTCRACSMDADCMSGACNDDGTCISPSAIVYLDPAGNDTGTCTSTSPCRSITFAVTQTSDARPHMVMHSGAYVENVNFTAYTPPTPHVYLHGGGSTLSKPTGYDGATFTASGFSIRNLTIVNESGRALNLASGSLLHAHVRSQGDFAAILNGQFDVRDTIFEGEGGGAAISLGGNGAVITLDRVQIQGPFSSGVVSTGGETVIITNTLIYGTTDLALDLGMVSAGTISFTTIADSGNDTGTGPKAVNCSANVTFKDSIIWVPGTTTRLPLAGCGVASSIVGPGAISGVSNADPKFANASAHDYHLSSASPAIDVASVGPDHDFEGDARPQGSGYDIGADEAK